jgi:hypothetical protein
MTIAATAQAAHPAMESNAPMLGSHEYWVGPLTVCTVTLVTPARMKRQ